jgi:hypothetical protein
MSRCSVPRCKKHGREIAGLCAAHWGSLPEHTRHEMLTLAEKTKSGAMADHQAFARAQGRLVMDLAQQDSPMKADHAPG